MYSTNASPLGRIWPYAGDSGWGVGGKNSTTVLFIRRGLCAKCPLTVVW
ncbi:Hypothetical protein Cul05146_0543 [Corynebacterium ulcerans]|uniref:Uncharacterized protein n=1 Tax=Corynebacterium ulcerans FRC58 TaxID=1408268 RepID=A0ABM5TZR6_CORUL|nr:Hypothetical protein Cul05146_0543 [Corynebacterium ulcerans]AKN76426.1 Hypothetical protein CulFRC58_0572 [Corynebacterium ulcerans FRC58]